MKNLAFLSAILFALLSINCLSFSGNGSGTPGDPYQITNVDQLQEMEDVLDAYYILMNDIDASDTENWNSGQGFDPVGTDNFPFMGTLDGNGYTIDGLYINRPNEDDVGLFGYCLNVSKFVDIRITNAYIKGNSDIGILAGWMKYQSLSSVIINDCLCSGTLISVSDNYFSTIGGIFGMVVIISNTEITIQNCLSDVVITADKEISGGLIGMVRTNDNAYILDCKSEGIIESQSDYVGGFIGSISIEPNGDLEIQRCMSNSNVIGNTYIGAFIGRLFNMKTTTILNCTSYGDVTFSEYHAGGFIGEIYNFDAAATVYVENCLCTGEIYDNSSNSDASGFVGTCQDDQNTFSCCFWEENNADYDIAYYDGTFNYDHNEIHKKTQEEMQSYSTFASCFDFVDDWVMGYDVMPRDNFYPIQRSLVPAGSIIPTLTEWAAILFGGLLFLVGGWFIYFR